MSDYLIDHLKKRTTRNHPTQDERDRKEQQQKKEARRNL
jgi:hypothetical protein